MKNVFLDLGTHYGQGLREFIDRFQMNESWIIHTFEANPLTYEIFNRDYKNLTPWVISHNKAVSNHNGVINVNIETPPGEISTGMGTSIIDLEKWNPWGGELRDNFKTTTSVECFDLSEFITNNFDEKDNIIVKMDIEGSEYDTLFKMIEDDSLKYINHLVVEWHSHFFTNSDEMREKETIIREKINSYDGLVLENWK